MVRVLLILLAVVSWVNVATAGCFRQNPPGRPQLHPTTFIECLDIIKSLVKYDKAYAPTLFSRRPGQGFQLPRHWIIGSCMMTLDMHSDDDEDSVSFYKIGVEAGVVNGACVARPPHLGGTIPVGPNQVINVTLYGLARREQILFTSNRSTLLHNTS